MTARGWFLFSLMGVVWGVPYLMIKVAVDTVSPSGVVFTRCALGAAILLPFALRKGGCSVLWGPTGNPSSPSPSSRSSAPGGP
ncbi:EamA family transporter [Streptomyces sp. NPDC054844]